MDILKTLEGGLNGGIGDLKKNLRSQKDKLLASFDKIKGLVANMNTEDGTQSIIIPPSEKVFFIGNQTVIQVKNFKFRQRSKKISRDCFSQQMEPFWKRCVKN